MTNLELIKQTKLFEGLSESEMKKIVDGCKEQAFPMGTIIIRENDPPKKLLYIVKSGEIVISTSAPGASDCGSSTDSMLTTIGVADVFGEISLIDNDPHSASVRAMSDSTILIMPATHFFDVVEEDKNVGYIVIRNIARILCQRLRETNMTIHFGLVDNHDS